MKTLSKVVFVLFFFAIGLFLTGCVNLEQKTSVNSDGSGSMKIKYWTRTNNILGDDLGTFAFTEKKVKVYYSSGSTNPSNINIEKDLTEDSLTIVTLDLKFNHINNLPDAFSFSKVKTSWSKEREGINFKYTLLQDTTNAKQFGMKDYKLNYEFEFPGEVISTNGIKDGKKVTWNFTVADLIDDIDLIATIKENN